MCVCYVFRILADDHRGVGEPLNETENGRGLVIRGKHYIIFDDAEFSNHIHRALAQEVAYPYQLAFINSQTVSPPAWDCSAKF